MKNNGVNHSMSVNVQNRRKKVIDRLEAQLKSGEKPYYDKNDKIIGMNVPLTEFDIKRINSEITVLKSRIYN